MAHDSPLLGLDLPDAELQVVERRDAGNGMVDCLAVAAALPEDLVVFETSADPVAHWQLRADSGLVVLAGLVVRPVPF
ncbi:hypothetical protein [Streptomyces sp. CA-106110]|uniref:hypothetical protein n=1 Tax=Streptomyces sp. CA-106110 TaxID=3240044 RepID=UPI003D8BB3C2